jgi:hypothetical protein
MRKFMNCIRNYTPTYLPTQSEWELDLLVTAGEAFGGELDLFKPPPSMNLADEWTPTPNNEAAKDNKY